MARYGTRAEALRAWEAKRRPTPRMTHTHVWVPINTHRGIETLECDTCGRRTTVED